ncbi:MAG: hypothetical protein EON59_04055 [Alphaproteobacteria bacterium]|nr:MAG: hypothetical protein EON59_04055 [Alphaproteobacteria bacterium]
MALHPIFADIIDAHARVTIPVTPNMHRGWRISFDFPPIPCRDFDWSATSPDYDADCDGDGFYQCAGHIVHGRTRDDVVEAINAWFAENEA